MNNLEDRLTSLFAGIDGATPIDPDLRRAVVPASRAAPHTPRRWALLGTAMVCLSAGVVGWIAVAVRSGNSAEDQAPANETPAVETTALLRAPDTLATVATTAGVRRDPSVDDQPVIDTVRLFPVYEAVGGSTTSKYLRGDMANSVGVEGLVGRRSNEALVDLVSIRVMRSRFGPAPVDSTLIEIGARTGVLVNRSARVATVILDGDPVIEFTGRDPMGFLSEGGIEAIITTDEPSLGGWLKYTATLGALPAGFELVVPLTPTRKMATCPW